MYGTISESIEIFTFETRSLDAYFQETIHRD